MCFDAVRQDMEDQALGGLTTRPLGFRRLTGPQVLDPLARKERFEELVKELEEIFNEVADQADTFYGVAQ